MYSFLGFLVLAFVDVFVKFLFFHVRDVVSVLPALSSVTFLLVHAISFLFPVRDGACPHVNDTSLCPPRTGVETCAVDSDCPLGSKCCECGCSSRCAVAITNEGQPELSYTRKSALRVLSNLNILGPQERTEIEPAPGSQMVERSDKASRARLGRERGLRWRKGGGKGGRGRGGAFLLPNVPPQFRPVRIFSWLYFSFSSPSENLEQANKNLKLQLRIYI